MKINEEKALVKHILCDCKCNFNSTTCNQKWNQKWNTSRCQCESNKYLVAKKDYR